MTSKMNERINGVTKVQHFISFNSLQNYQSHEFWKIFQQNIKGCVSMNNIIVLMIPVPLYNKPTTQPTLYSCHYNA